MRSLISKTAVVTDDPWQVLEGGAGNAPQGTDLLVPLAVWVDARYVLVERAGRTVGDLKRGGNWRRERALQFPITVDPDDDACFIPTLKDPVDLQLIVAGGWGPCTAICHGWSGGSRAVHGRYAVPGH
jgi:hypothetical protein